jgi:hypothetical protein
VLVRLRLGRVLDVGVLGMLLALLMRVACVSVAAARVRAVIVM